MPAFPFYKQLDGMDCGPSCLRMIAKYYGKAYSLQYLREKSRINREGVSIQGISEAAESIGFKTMGVMLTFDKLVEEAPLPCIVHWEQEHFIVIHDIKESSSLFGRQTKGKKIYYADPKSGLGIYTENDFLKGWLSTTRNEKMGTALLLEPSPTIHEEIEETSTHHITLEKLFAYLKGYKKLLTQLGLGLLAGCILQMVFPFLTQSIVDIGINNQNLNFVYLVLAAQLMLFAGRTFVDIVRSWILLHISSRINVSLLSGFLTKLMRLPISFFDTKMFGDIMQRFSDHHRIESFLTSTTLETLFSIVNILVFGIVLAVYYLPIFGIFITGTLLYCVWIVLFQKKRRLLDYRNFAVEARNQSSLIQLIQGITEIKLANIELKKRWEWEKIQAQLFKLNIKSLALSQYQQAGAFFLNEGKNILITFLSAKAVIEGQLTLGEMLAIQYIIGQLNAPVEQLIRFFQTMQDAQISIERMNEIHRIADEEPYNHTKANQLPIQRSLTISNLTFQYPGTLEPVLKNIHLHIPEGMITAIVGMSGSGKTTLLKLLLKVYEPSTGKISIGENNLSNISQRTWRNECGVVMQDGFLFSDTIAHNIALSEEYPNDEQLLKAVQLANIQSYIDSLPLGFQTKIGMEGNSISQGQKQRILIARAVYKNPSFVFLDEATNALDTDNESNIMRNLEQFFIGRTVLIVAHRLSTVRNADKIIVLHQGEIAEEGTHEELIHRKGKYFTLVKNQLELGN